MNPISFFMFKKLLCICGSAIFILLTSSVDPTLSVDPRFESCKPKTCGNGPIIKFPFWSSHHQESFCGYPDLEVTCNDEKPVIRLSGEDYVIKDIDYTDQSLLVSNAAVYEDSCPKPVHNLSLDQTPFHISPGYTPYLFFLYNCTSKPDDLTFPMDCASSSGNYCFAGFHLELYNYSCNHVVNAPVRTGDDFGALRSMNYSEILKMGFLLNWTAHDCNTCETSGGRCGFENGEFVCFCRDQPHSRSCDDGSEGRVRRKIIVGILTGGAGSLFSIFICYAFRRTSSIRSVFLPLKRARNSQDLEKFIRSYGPLAIKRYDFSDVKKITNKLKDKLGQGGYGSVFKGKLTDGRLVAVKILNDSTGNGEEFINEIASISRTSHVNIVTLLGFCLEGSKRVLIYDFMPNGSLEKFINMGNAATGSCRLLGWEKLHQIALGAARGLEYLHRGCNTRIVHFDIKPHNILLDEDFCPKIADFGLARLCNRKDSIMSMWEARGTVGYIAPEVFSRQFGGVSHKSDVYSYGMTILEMVGEREDGVTKTDDTSEKYFPYWIYKRLELVQEHELHGATAVEEIEIPRKLAIVGLWCIRTNPSDRPSISRVIEMLEGSLETLEIPPQPFSSSPAQSPSYSSNVSTP